MSKEYACPIVKIKKFDPAAVIPRYEYQDDSGADLYAIADCTLQPLERKAIPTGLYVEVPAGLELQIRPKSGLALESGITVLNTPGTIDSGYRGEIKVILINLGSEPYQIKKGQKIAQLVVAPVVHVNFQEVDNLSASKRGTGGFGSTGIA
jgi:dUTP pyrophosphatase